jgi:hypothetical protein
MKRTATITLICENDEAENVPVLMVVRVSPCPSGAVRGSL